MSRHLRLWGFLFTLLLLLGAILWPELEERFEDRAEARQQDATFDRITFFMPEDEVRALLGKKGGEAITGPGWPAVLGDMPGHEKGCPKMFRPRDLEDSDPERPVWWKQWPSSSGKRAIAVAFVHESGSLWVIAARKVGPGGPRTADYGGHRSWAPGERR